MQQFGVDGRYFRAGARTVICNDVGHILLFQRTDYPDIWQFQQGGIDSGESVETTLWRELHEEIALTKEDFFNITAYPLWTTYEYEAAAVQNLENPVPDCLDQVHRWFFLKIKPNVNINLAQAPDQEFSTYRWVKFAEAVAMAHKIKYLICEALYDFFKSELQNTQEARKQAF